MSCAKSQYIWCDPPDYETQKLMEFHLVYAGNLLKSGSSGHTWEKHQVRRYLHPQLKKLWETHPLLSFYAQSSHVTRHGRALTIEQHHNHTRIEDLARQFEGYVPLVMADFGMVCEL